MHKFTGDNKGLTLFNEKKAILTLILIWNLYKVLD